MPKVLTDSGMGRCIGCYSCMQACARMVYNDFSPHNNAIQVRTVGGMNGRLVANICRACPEPVPRVKVCPTDALITRKGGRSSSSTRASASAVSCTSKPAWRR